MIVDKLVIYVLFLDFDVHNILSINKKYTSSIFMDFVNTTIEI